MTEILSIQVLHLCRCRGVSECEVTEGSGTHACLSCGCVAKWTRTPDKMTWDPGDPACPKCIAFAEARKVYEATPWGRLMSRAMNHQGEWVLTGWDLIELCEQMASTDSDDVFISWVDDTSSMNSVLCFVRTAHEWMALYVPQNGKDPAVFDLNPLRVKYLGETLAKMIARDAKPA